AYTLATGAAASTDALYSGFDAADVAAANSDDDTASVTVEPAAVTVAESGTTDTFTVVLDVEPAGNVVITVTPTDPGEATAGPGQLTFTTGNWSTPQTVTVTGVGDSLADGDQVTTISLTVNTGSTLDPGYDAIDPPDVTVTTVDDVIAISATAPSASTASASRSANVHATTTHPLNPSTVTPSTFLVHGGRTGRLTGNRSTPTATTFQFDPANDFKPGETIHVTATGAIEGTASNSLRPHVWQFTAAAGAGTGAFSAHPTNPNFAAGDYTAVLGDLDEDGDLDAIFISNGNHDTVWLNDGTGAFTFHANFGNVSASKPGIALGDLDGDGDLDAVVTGRFDDETVWLNDGAANFSLHSSFDVNWTTRVALGDLDGDGDLDAVTGHEDAGGRTWLNDGSATFSAHPATPAFGAGGPQEIVLGDVDGDGDLDAVMPGYNGAERVWRNDGAGSFSAGPAFGNDPFGNWDNTWTLGLGDLDGDGDLDALTANMSTQPEKVWLNDGTGTFSAHPAIPGFGAGDSRAVLLGDLDGDGDLDAIVLDALGSSEPVWINDGTGGFSAHPSVPALATGGDSWGGALGDIDGDGDLDAVICGAGNPRQDETVWLNERIVLTPSSGLSTNESGSLVSFEVVLGRQPTANVSFQLSSGDPTEARLSDDGSTQQNALTITFTNSNWSTPQVVTVHGQDDAVTDGTIAYTIVTDAVMSSDPFYSGMNPRDVTGTNADDDSGGVTVSPAAVSVAESGATATFTVVLDVQPAAAVVIDVSSADPAEATVSPAQLTFDTANWSTPQTVTVTGVDDTVDDGDQVTTIDVAVNTAATADPAYDTVDPDDVTATTTDNDTAGVTRTPSAVTVSESGTTATFTVVLLTEPTGDVVLDVTPSDAGEATSSPAQLTFTAGDWSSPQTVTVTGTDDVLDDGNQTSTIVLAMNAGATTDPVYDPINPADVTVTTTDDDKTPSTTTLASSVNPSTSGQSVTFTATVTAGATGTVTFKNGAATLGTVTLASGSASLAVANLAPGTHSITATYNGNATYDVSTSNTVSQTVNLSPFGAPLFFTATGATATSIALNWGAVSGATNYEIYRTDSISTPYALIHTTTATAYTNSGLTANKTYLYKVLANGSVGPSPFSTPDLGTTVIFTDPTLTNAIKVKAAHVTQLRTAINAARTAAGLGAATFTDPAPAIVKRIHFTEMRTALDAARTALGLSAIAYTDPAITVASTKVKAAHVVDLRKGVQ
ncbi:MAG TPA: FG-GAP-like repeat-containing protein, partial [Thermoanaerobaculia bacterium]|nr:FG-GAP-like repeat-containing protein [Thermoanaerobaculia bacterium]